MIDAPYGTLTTVIDGGASPYNLLACILFGDGRDCIPEWLLKSHVYLARTAKAYPWRDELAASYCEGVVAAWRKITTIPALLRTPRISVPAILKACDCGPTSLGKAAKVILAAADVVQVTLPPSDRAALQAVAASASHSAVPDAG